MEFRRTEVKRVLRHRESVFDSEECRRIFEAIEKRNLLFILDAGTGGKMHDCAVLTIEDEEVYVFSGRPQKIRRKIRYEDIRLLEIECNCDIVAEDDGAGRWAYVA